MCVDDLLDSSDTVEPLTQDLQHQLTTLMGSAGLHLRKLASNEPAVVESIPESDHLSTVDFTKDGAAKTKTLGVMWEAKDDLFTFQIKITESNKPLTKRSVLSSIATIYDPPSVPVTIYCQSQAVNAADLVGRAGLAPHLARQLSS